MTPIVLPLPGNDMLGQSLAKQIRAEVGRSEIRPFPDGESYVRIDMPVLNRAVVIVCTLDRPNAKFIPLSFMVATARDLGASQVGLVCPYLPYMRQDKRFHPGEALSSTYFAAMIGERLDWLVTVDPHLHRRSSLGEIFSIPTSAVHAAPLLSSWIRENVADAILIGPDSESEQWVASVAAGADVPYTVLQKTRRGDHDVKVSIPDLGNKSDRNPVLVDDIISTGRTMIEAIRRLKTAGHKPPVCVGVHAIFAEDAYADLRAAGAREIVTCNTVPHESNAIDISAIAAEAVRSFLP
jgi:ribose-phosphate pyrophosphokinase